MNSACVWKRCLMYACPVGRVCTTANGGLREVQLYPRNEELLSYIHGPTLDDQRRPVIGSDWDVVSPKTCTEKRKREKCLLGFVEVLTDLGLDTSIPPEEGSPVKW